jgi:hypothetical protein
MSEIIFFSASKHIFFCRNDVQAIDFLRKGNYAPEQCGFLTSNKFVSIGTFLFVENMVLI